MTGNIDFSALLPDEDTNQARVLRMVLASIESDLTQMTAVTEETMRDEHGPDIATWSIIMGMADVIAKDWISHTDRETTIAAIQKILVKTAGEQATA